MLNRELHSKEDFLLLVLERMRIIDTAHNWSPGTHTQYQGKLKYIQKFQARFPGLEILQSGTFNRPPADVDIPLMWAEESYSLAPGRFGANVTFGTVRTLRSALSQFETVKALQSGQSARMDQQRRLLFQDCRVTDRLSHTLWTSGFGVRIGTETKPAIALLMRHVIAMDTRCLENYLKATTPAARRHWALGGLCNSVLWLGWLRSAENFNLRWSDVAVVLPRDGPSIDLPANIGACLLNLGPSTKTQQTKQVSVVIAYQSMSGLSCGRWFRRAFQSCGGVDMKTDHRYIFHHSFTGKNWTSRYFRTVFLYPMLEELRRNGDPFLRAFDGSEGNSIPKKFWSLHCYRRGARTHATKGSKRDSKKASKDQVYEHGRWRRRRATEAIDKQYDEWTIQDRIQITLFCH